MYPLNTYNLICELDFNEAEKIFFLIFCPIVQPSGRFPQFYLLNLQLTFKLPTIIFYISKSSFSYCECSLFVYKYHSVPTAEIVSYLYIDINDINYFKSFLLFLMSLFLLFNVCFFLRGGGVGECWFLPSTLHTVVVF